MENKENEFFFQTGIFRFISLCIVLISLFQIIFLFLAINDYFFNRDICYLLSNKEEINNCLEINMSNSFSYLYHGIPFIVIGLTGIVFGFLIDDKNPFDLYYTEKEKTISVYSLSLFSSSFVFIMSVLIFFFHEDSSKIVRWYTKDFISVSFIFLVIQFYVIFYYKKEIGLRVKEREEKEK